MKTILNKLILFGAMSVFIAKGWSQVWVESYQYGGSALDPAKWTPLQSSGVSLEFLNPGIRMYPTSGTLKAFLVDWHYQLPTSSDWTVVQRFKGNSTGGWKNAYVSAGDGLTITYEHQTIAGQTPANSTWFSTVTSDKKYVVENWDYHWFGLAYDSQTRTMNRVFSLDSGLIIPAASSFQSVSSSSVDANSTALTITTGVIFQAGGGDLTFTDFQIVPYTVPESSAFSLLLAGGAVIAAAKRRRLV